jgi:dTDP-4-amino-4,6-dideoxygalactose transaminase
MANMDAIIDIAARHDVVVIEDAAQMRGAEYKAQRTGSISTSAASASTTQEPTRLC